MIIDETTNLDKFWLVNDGLNMTSNLYFGLGKSYFCGHGCHVCSIRDELIGLKKSTPKIYNNNLESMNKSWHEMYSFFATIALDEDPYYFKLNHKNEYDWYVKNSSMCSYGTTDNGIFRISKLKDVKFKSIYELSLSMTFIKKVGHEKLIKTLNEIKIPILRVKFLIDLADFYPNEIINWVKSRNLPLVVHSLNLALGSTNKFDTSTFDRVHEVDWLIGKKNGEFIKIHVNSDVIVYYNNCYFSNNPNEAPYYTIGADGFNYRLFLSSMLEGKQKAYLTYLPMIDNSIIRKYFLTTQNYKVNHNFNFIPNFMVDYKIKFFTRMMELGWNATNYGLVEGNPSQVIPIIERV